TTNAASFLDASEEGDGGNSEEATDENGKSQQRSGGAEGPVYGNGAGGISEAGKVVFGTGFVELVPSGNSLLASGGQNDAIQVA
ncbi:MAG: hypothetical protein PHV97_06105, partial [Candidatus Omnitrophica bacterium]|nr:hypothetical protein [Candidatus Omnitrophota bacterium]